MTVLSTSARIRALNDAFRQTLVGGKVVLTFGVAACSTGTQDEILKTVRGFNSFEADNDPHGEHDFGSFELEGKTIFWKIDYYDHSLEHGSEDPADPAQTGRVLTIMLADEY